MKKPNLLHILFVYIMFFKNLENLNKPIYKPDRNLSLANMAIFAGFRKFEYVSCWE